MYNAYNDFHLFMYMQTVCYWATKRTPCEPRDPRNATGSKRDDPLSYTTGVQPIQ